MNTKPERLVYTVKQENPKHKWWNKEPKFFIKQYYLRVDNGYVVAEEIV